MAPGQRVRVRREVAGRRGKGVTTVYDLPLDDAALRELAGRLKKRCGVGGSAKNGVIELQGDHRDVVMDVLRAEGYDAVLAGGERSCALQPARAGGAARVAGWLRERQEAPMASKTVTTTDHDVIRRWV